MLVLTRAPYEEGCDWESLPRRPRRRRVHCEWSATECKLRRGTSC